MPYVLLIYPMVSVYCTSGQMSTNYQKSRKNRKAGEMRTQRIDLWPLYIRFVTASAHRDMAAILCDSHHRLPQNRKEPLHTGRCHVQVNFVRRCNGSFWNGLMLPSGYGHVLRIGPCRERRGLHNGLRLRRCLFCRAVRRAGAGGHLRLASLRSRPKEIGGALSMDSTKRYFW